MRIFRAGFSFIAILAAPHPASADGPQTNGTLPRKTTAPNPQVDAAGAAAGQAGAGDRKESAFVLSGGPVLLPQRRMRPSLFFPTLHIS